VKLDRLVHAFWRRTEVPFREVFHDTDAQYDRIVWLLRAYYAWVLWYVWGKALRPRYLVASQYEPMWPVAWISWVPWDVGASAIIGLCVGGAALALLFPRRPLARILAFLGLFEFLALWYTYTGVQHRTYTMLALALFFALAPRMRASGASEDEKRRALMAVFGGLVFVLFTYSWAGALKIWGVIEAVLRGDAEVLSFHSVPVTLLLRAYRFESPPPLSEFVLNHPALATFGFFTVIYAELCSVSAAFRPHLQRFWLAMLAVFHLTTLLSMKVFFLPATAVLVILAAFTPFGRSPLRWRPALREVPWLGPLASALLHRLETLAGSPGRTILYAPEGGGPSPAALRRLLGPLPGSISIESQGSDAFGLLCSEHPFLWEERQSLVSLDVRGDDRAVRLRAAALLHALSGCPGARGWLFALLLVPVPLWNLLWRLRHRSSTRESVADSSPGLAS
jgi:hypothetical protein